MDKKRIEKAVRDILVAIGEDPRQARIVKTPERVANMYAEILAGTLKDAGRELTVFHEEDHEEMVMIKDIPLYSICEHHLLPFIGKAHVAYIPTRGRVTGLSKIARLVDTLARRLQLQERLTRDLANLLMEKLRPKGVLVVVEAEHLCMSMRGVNKPGTTTVTSAVRGVFRKSATTRAEAMALISESRLRER